MLKKVKIGSFAKVQGGYAFKSTSFCEKGIPVIKITNVQDRYLNLDKISYVSNDSNVGLERFLIKEGDILISMTGNGPHCDSALVGRVARYNGKDDLYYINQRVGRFLIDESQIRKDYLYYLIGRPEVNRELASMSTGSANQANINASTIESLEILLPSLNEQDEILKLVLPLDQKIELNNQMNETLEAMARAIFKEWFIDFGPVRAKAEGRRPFGMDDETAALFPDSFEESELGMIPKGWRIGSYQEIMEQIKETIQPQDFKFEFCSHYSLPNFDSDKFAALEQVKTIKSNKFRAFHNSILFSKLNPRTPRVWITNHQESNNEISFASTEFIVLNPKINTDRWLVYCYLTEKGFLESMTQNASGTSNSHQRIKPDIVLEYSLAYATQDLMLNFSNAVDPLFNQILVNQSEIKHLKALRDLLLPRLISGEIEI